MTRRRALLQKKVMRALRSLREVGTVHELAGRTCGRHRLLDGWRKQSLERSRETLHAKMLSSVPLMSILLFLALFHVPQEGGAESPLEVRHPVLDTHDHPLLKRYPYLPVLCGWTSGSDAFSAQWVKEQVEVCYRQWLDPTYPEDARAALKAGEDISRQAFTAIRTGEFERAGTLVDSLRDGLFRKYRVQAAKIYVLEDSQKGAILQAQESGLLSPPLAAADFDSLFSLGRAGGIFHLHLEEEELRRLWARGSELASLLFFRKLELEQEAAGSLATPVGTFERLVEVASLHAFSVHPRRAGMTVRYGVAPPRVRFLKGLEIVEERITLRIRTQDCYEVDRGNRSISLAHPRRSLGKYKLFLEYVFGETGLGKSVPYCYEGALPIELPVGGFSDLGGCKQFVEIREVVVVLYFPGRESGTEIVVAQFGIERDRYDRKRWRRLKADDGTFQDHLKAHGTYWLHGEMPDMGTPAHLLR